MLVRFLKLTAFRNLQSVLIQPNDKINIFYGCNASGKTNLLEAVFMLCLGKSQRGAADLDMVNRDGDAYRLEGTIVQSEQEAQIVVAYQRGQRKRLMVNGLSVRAGELFGRFSVVAAGPEDTQVLSGAPSARRTFLDMYLSQTSHRYLTVLGEYWRVLAQKNAALKAEGDTSAFDELLVATGGEVMACRAAFLSQVASIARDSYSRLAQGAKLDICYSPSTGGEITEFALEPAKRLLEEALARSRDREQRLQTALIGPHRDDVTITIDSGPARTQASQGEKRTAAVCLKLAVYDILHQARGVAPLLLLDEVFAELDDGRTNAVMENFHQLGQVFLTTAGSPPEAIRSGARSFHVVDGRVSEAS